MGMVSVPSTKPHAVLVPYPTQGHINPFMQLAKLLHSKGFHITFVNNEHNHRRLLRSKGLHFVQAFEGIKFEAVPDGLPPSDRDATQDILKLTESIICNKSMNKPFGDLLQRLNSSTHGSDPLVTCVISDVFMFFAWEVADELGIPNVQFWTASACGLLGYLQYDELLRRGIVPFKDENFMTDGSLEALVDWIPGMPNNMRLKDMPSLMRITTPDDFLFNFLSEAASKGMKSSAMLINTFDDLEHQVVEEIKKMQPNMFLGGPLDMLLRHITPNRTEVASFTSSLWKEDTQCLEWLDKQAPESVIYANYGSVTVMSDHHMNEFAWGLANSKHPFLWIMRPDVVMGAGTLPQEFYDEIKDRGLITSWCPQPQVLKHPSIGVYLTHCGWNSITESLAGGGVPLMCWPFFAEQQTNSRFACTVWGIGVEVNEDVKREEVAEQVKEMLEEGRSRGEQLRKNAKEWSRKAEVATQIGGSSYADFERFMEKVVHLIS